MTGPRMYGLAATAGVLILTSIAAPAGAAENTAVPGQLGDQWEVASRISMPMAMSALQSRICDLASIPVPAGAGEATAAPGEPGEKWEVTSQMSMEGMQMAMPPRTSTVCAPKEWKEPPAGDEGQNCQTSDFKVVGAKATWKMTCAGPPAMTGEGEITREGPDTYSGAIKFTSEGGNITIKLSGKRLGSCEL